MDFSALRLSAPLLKAVEEVGYTQPSPIQCKAIPPVLDGYDLLGCAQTGTGKTAAFAMPVLQLLAAHRPHHRKVRALVLTPTRELALQIDESFAQYGKYLTVSHAVVFGGVGQAPQVAALQRGVDVLVACPGRLNDLINQGHVDLSAVEIFVLDEADRMLDMGFVHDVERVIRHLPEERQNLMFSATMPKEIEQLASSILEKPVTVKVDPVSSTVDRIDQKLYLVDKPNKIKLLVHLLQDRRIKNALVFSRTKHGADKIVRILNREGVSAAAIHGNKGQTARVNALEGFKSGQVRVLVATDIAARGIDINELSHVFNYDLPEVPETYVHRIGRTARAGAGGTAISFCSPEEMEYLQGIEKLNRKKIPVISGHPYEAGGEQQPPAQTPAKPMKKTEKPARKEAEEKKASAPKKPVKAQAAAEKADLRKEESSVEEKQNQPTGLSASAKRRRRRRRAAARPEGKPAQNAAQAAPQSAEQARTAPAEKAEKNEKNGRSGKKAAQQQPKAAPRTQQKNNRNQRAQAQRPAAAPKPAPERPARTSRADDPGLLLISRKPPKQKFANFEEYIQSRGGVTIPIEGDEDE